ncbi:MAG: 3-deoxy-manno-octulosonate cytidylyltransferase [Planctomycetes bacterium]|nr:3-deoxy-manno-octulosonate cytidylyltransferase [Planctomycetota bacterium]
MLAKPAALAVIPARYGSTRFPGKPLANRTGKFLIQHVVERVRLAKSIAEILVATDDRRIFDAVVSFGGRAVMTRPDHPNGTSRIAEVVEKLRHPVIVNVQGDEPDIEPGVIDLLIKGLHADPDAPMATLASDFAPDEDPTNPNIVKLVTATVGGRVRALYFSRSLIPFDRDKSGKNAPGKPLKHPGLYAYRRDFLLKYVTLSATPLEQTEQLEQLRALEHGYPIAVIKADVRHHGIDTPEQYEEFVKRTAKR